MTPPQPQQCPLVKEQQLVRRNKFSRRYSAVVKLRVRRPPRTDVVVVAAFIRRCDQRGARQVIVYERLNHSMGFPADRDLLVDLTSNREERQRGIR